MDPLLEDVPVRALVEAVRIGSINGGGPDTFGRITALAADQLGRVYVADAFRPAIQVFQANGTHLRTLGDAGRGPSEIEDPQGLAWQNGSLLWIVDYGNDKYVVFDTAGAHVRDHRRGPIGALWPWPGGFSGERLVEACVCASGYGLVTVDPNAPFEVVERFPYPATGVALEAWSPSVYIERGSTVWRLPMPFTAGVQWSISRDGHLWVGDSRRYRAYRRTLAGDTLVTATRDIPQTPVTEAELQAALDSLGDPPPVDARDLPSNKPAFRLLLSDQGTGVWVLREGPDAWFFDGFDTQGQHVETLRLPVVPSTRVRPVIDKAGAWVATEDDLGASQIVRLERR